MLTAQRAKEIADEANKQWELFYEKEIMELIEHAAKNGKFSIEVFYVQKVTKGIEAKLAQIGYKVSEVQSSPIASVRISWQ